MAHTHIVTDNDKHFVIDPATREITNESGKIVLAQHDHNSERFTFELPKEAGVDGHNMSLCNKIEIHFTNIELTELDLDIPEEEMPETIMVDGVAYVPTGTTYEGVYESTDVQIDGDTVTCSWLVSREATQYLGKLEFAVHFFCVGDNGLIEYAWSSAAYSGIDVIKSIYHADAVIGDYDKIPAGSITGDEIADDAMTTSKYAKESVTWEKLAVGSTAKGVEVTLAASNWVSGRQTVNVDGLLAKSVVFVGAAPTSISAYGAAGVVCSAQAQGQLTFTCESAPEVDLTVYVVMPK